jgi:hypothetical protein
VWIGRWMRSLRQWAILGQRAGDRFGEANRSAVGQKPPLRSSMWLPQSGHPSVPTQNVSLRAGRGPQLAQLYLPLADERRWEDIFLNLLPKWVR